jgi:hypothetical protein
LYYGSSDGGVRQLFSPTLSWDTAQWYNVTFTVDRTTDTATGAAIRFYLTSERAHLRF